MDAMVSTKRASHLLGVCVNTLRMWEKAGYIKAIRTPGGQFRFRLSEIKRMMGIVVNQ